jgi:hypothetical protein
MFSWFLHKHRVLAETILEHLIMFQTFNQDKAATLSFSSMDGPQ